MTVIASRLNYSGPVSGFDTSIIAPGDGTYVEYRRRQHEYKCDIFYKRNERMTFTDVDARVDAAQGQIFKWSASNSRLAGRWITTYGKTTGAQLGAGATTLHELNYASRLSTFNYP
jgi:hypothetical protein